MFEEILHRGPAINKASKALILLHGRGGSARDILSLENHFCDDSFCVIAPQAPNGTWYPHSFLEDERLNEPYLTESITSLKALIEETAEHIPSNEIYVMGFSQGACLTLEIAARYATKYGGIVAFTGGLIGSRIDKNKYHGNFDGTKVFIGTSDKDIHVPLIRAEESKAILETLGANVTLKVYKGMAHTINEDEIQWVKNNMFTV